MRSRLTRARGCNRILLEKRELSRIEELSAFYDRFDWNHSGEGWARKWGGSQSQWRFTILPRIWNFLPTGVVVEIGPGLGRISHFLRPFAQKLILSDFNSHCVETCRSKFLDDANVECHLTDGLNIGHIPNESVDFVFSFYSLVNADPFALDKCLYEISQKLKTNRYAFIHHSNGLPFGNYNNHELTVYSKHRDTESNADIVLGLIEKHGMTCKSQELVCWERSPFFTDCFTVFGKMDSRNGTAPIRIENWNFYQEVKMARSTSGVYEF